MSNKRKISLVNKWQLFNRFLPVSNQGQIIIAKGDVFSEFHIDALKALKLYGSKNNQINFLGIFIITALLFVLFERFLYFFYKNFISKHQPTY